MELVKVDYRKEYDEGTAFDKGYICYMCAEWSNSNIPKGNPFIIDTKEWHDFNMGSSTAMLEVMDGDDE